MSRLVLFLLFALISSRCADALVESDKLGWTEYRNDRFRLVYALPRRSVCLAPQLGLGGRRTLWDARWESLLVGALTNTDHFTPRSYQAFIARQSYPGL